MNSFVYLGWNTYLIMSNLAAYCNFRRGIWDLKLCKKVMSTELSEVIVFVGCLKEKQNRKN